MSACRSCAAPILWATTAKGESIPLDLEPRDDGNILLAGGTAVTLGDLERLLHRGRTPLYRAHFASCPQADQWRREKGRKP